MSVDMCRNVCRHVCGHVCRHVCWHVPTHAHTRVPSAKSESPTIVTRTGYTVSFQPSPKYPIVAKVCISFPSLAGAAFTQIAWTVLPLFKRNWKCSGLTLDGCIGAEKVTGKPSASLTFRRCCVPQKMCICATDRAEVPPSAVTAQPRARRSVTFLVSGTPRHPARPYVALRIRPGDACLAWANVTTEGLQVKQSKMGVSSGRIFGAITRLRKEIAQLTRLVSSESVQISLLRTMCSREYGTFWREAAKPKQF